MVCETTTRGRTVRSGYEGSPRRKHGKRFVADCESSVADLTCRPCLPCHRGRGRRYRARRGGVRQPEHGAAEELVHDGQLKRARRRRRVWSLATPRLGVALAV